MLAERFGTVIAVDSLHPQIHPTRSRPKALDARVELRVADVSEASTWDALLDSVEPIAVLLLAAETGTGQSLTEASRHAIVNVVGLTRLLDALAHRSMVPDHLVLTSSRAIYGEGAWQRVATGEVFYPGQRGTGMLKRAQWDFPGAKAMPLMAGVTEPGPTSIYGATKLAQESILRSWGIAFGARTTILRLQNVYGPGQSLANAYTGILSLFARLARNGEPIPLYEDGQMLRDFVFIDDVARAIELAFERPPQATQTLDIASGHATTIAEAANLIARFYKAPIPKVTGAFRNGDVRHASSRIEIARETLGFEPSVSLPEGLKHLCSWVEQASNG